MASEERVWTVIDIIKWGSGYLSEKGFDEARLTVELLLSETLGIKRFDLYVKHDQPLRRNELEAFKVLLKRRLLHEPVQYIVGRTNFYSIELKVDRRALIPRPETEVLAEAVIEHCRTYLSQRKVVSILDVGTGSGCIAIAVAKFVRNSVVTAIDTSKEALELAKENSVATGTQDKINFIQSDFLRSGESALGARFDILVSNPPYVPESELPSLSEDVKNFEPVKALSDGRDGMTFFRRISETASLLLRDGGWVFVETGYGQARKVEELFREHGATELLVKKDLSNIERVVRSRYFFKGAA